MPAWFRALVQWVGGRWLVIGALILTAGVLHLIRWPVDVTLHATTERVSFIGTEDTVLSGLPLTSVELRGLRHLRLALEEVREAGKLLARAGGGAALQVSGDTASLAIRSPEGLRLTRVRLPPETHLTLYVGREEEVLLVSQAGKGSQVEVGVLGGLSLRVKGMALVNSLGVAIPFATANPQHDLDATSVSRNIILEPEADDPFTLVLDLSGRVQGAGGGPVRLPFAERLKVRSLDFTREGDGKQLSAIRRLWVDPLLPSDRAIDGGFLELPKAELFRLQSLRLSRGALECELTGTPTSLKVGKSPDGRDLVPSLLQHLTGHVVFRTLCKPVGLC